ncbi:MAG: TonB-dependent receptor plug domain-containing protein [Chitinophagaceae bacterium]|nr:TonB-dependent receptor plug domain-containing protein [Chitinophagaceae bacterium]
MRKFLSRMALVLFVLFPLFAAAQSTITGRVLNEKDGTPVDGASVVIKGKTGGAKTDANGNFTIAANKGDVLIITSVGYTAESIKVKDASNYVVSLQKTDGTLEEVIVTAMDIRKKPREVSFATQTVKGSDIQESQRDNFINGLDGRVAGLTINSTSGMAGASSSIVLRGFNSMALDNQPLFVIDGVVMDNSSINETSNTGTGLGLVENSTRNVNQTANRSTDYTNRMADINPNDIESVTVLKGPEATALYGSQASSGAIIVTTRRGRKDGKIGITYDNSFRISALTRFPEISDKWSPGTNTVPGNLFSYFGPEQSASTPKYDNMKNFFQTGFSQTHNLAVETGNDKSSIRGSASFLDQTGIVPNNNFRRVSLKVAYKTTIKDIITISPNVTLTYSTNDKPKRGAGGYMLNLLIWPRTNDASNFLSPEGKKLTLYSSDPNGELDNPYFNVEFNKGQDVTLRKSASTNVTIKPTKWFTLTGIFGIDNYSTNGWSFYHPLSAILSKGTGAH